MRQLRNTRTISVIVTGHAFIQNRRRGSDDLRLAAAFDELSHAI